VKEVYGRVLEIGFGTGLNLFHYPEVVHELHAVDNNPKMHAKAARRIGQTDFPVYQHQLEGEALPMESKSFDCVVSTFTLCSIASVHQAMSEIWRVLKPGGRFHFLEHGLSPDPKVAGWQELMNPIQNFIGDGCQLNRPIKNIICSQRFVMEPVEHSYLKKMPRIVGCLYQGQALKV
jgi:ubiquinone/menaquinone biosynthesis C-methylase UbiE